MKALTDAQFDEFKSLCNASIHELVFATVHAENNEPDEAKAALVAVALNISRLQELVSESAPD